MRGNELDDDIIENIEIVSIPESSKMGYARVNIIGNIFSIVV